MSNQKHDRYYISSQAWELRTVAKRFGITVEDVKRLRSLRSKSKGKVSRRGLYADIREEADKRAEVANN